MSIKPIKKLFILIIVAILVLFFGFILWPAETTFYAEKTDKSPETSQIESNLYRNTKYKFRIKFPEGWEIKPGDGPSVVQKAVSGNKSIILMVREGDIPNSYTIKDVSSLEDFKNYVFEDIQKSDKDVEILDFGETKINNKPAYWIKHSGNSSTLGIDVEVVGTIYFVVHNGYTYVITTSTPPEEYNYAEKTFQKSLVTFVFEDF